MKHLKIGRYEIYAFFIIIFALVLRILLISQGWPRTNSDEGTLGLMALHIAYRGEHPIFFYGQGYMGSFEAYVAALFFQLFGPSLFTLRFSLIVILAFFFVSMYFLTSLLYTKKLALITLSLLGLGSEGILFVQLRAIGGYAETLLFGSLLLLLASWLALSFNGPLPKRRRWLRLVVYACWGYLVGFSIWTDLLIMPFVLMSGLLLLLVCWPDLDSWAPSCIISSFILGILPTFIYNFIALPQQSSLFYFLLDYRADTTGSALTQVPLLQKMIGALLVGLPNATGANPICSTQTLPLFGLLSPTSLQCTLLQGSWAIGNILLWSLAVFFTARAIWQHRHQLKVDVEYAEERQTTIRHLARLMLLGSAGLTFLLFALSPVAGLDPWTNSRYLLCLLIATPALIAPLCKENELRSLIHQRFIAIFRVVILTYICAMLVLGTIGTFNIVPTVQAADQQENELISHLLRIGATRIYSEYWTCDRLIFDSNERIICSVVNEHIKPGYNRYSAYYFIVKRNAAHATYVFPLDSPQAINFAEQAAQSSRHYQRFIFDGYVVYQPT